MYSHHIRDQPTMKKLSALYENPSSNGYCSLKMPPFWICDCYLWGSPKNAFKCWKMPIWHSTIFSRAYTSPFKRAHSRGETCKLTEEDGDRGCHAKLWPPSVPLPHPHSLGPPHTLRCKAVEAFTWIIHHLRKWMRAKVAIVSLSDTTENGV